MDESNQDKELEDLYLKYYKELFSLAVKIIKNKKATEDVVNEVFYIALLKLDTLLNHPNKIAWFYKVLYFCIQKLKTIDCYNQNEIKNIDYHPNLFEDYKDILTQIEFKYLIYKFGYNLNIKEISKILNKSKTTVTTHAFRMKEKLELDDIEEKLIKELESQMKTVKDETSVEEIRRLVKDLEELSPSNDYILDKSYLDFKKDFYYDALEAKNLIKTFDKKEKFNKFKVAILLILIFLGVSSIVAIRRLGFKEDTLERSFNILGNEKYKSYEEIEKKFGTKILKPKKLPKGYELNEFDFFDSESFSMFIISYYKDKDAIKEISYTITIQKSIPTSYKEIVEVSPDYRKEYFHENIKFDIFKNIDIYGCIFEYMNVSYILAGFENEADVIEFIDSLKKD